MHTLKQSNRTVMEQINFAYDLFRGIQGRKPENFHLSLAMYKKLKSEINYAQTAPREDFDVPDSPFIYRGMRLKLMFRCQAPVVLVS